MTDRDRILAAFKKLRQQGYIARTNYLCCGSCGHDACKRTAKERNKRGYVFWHRQEETMAWCGRTHSRLIEAGLYLQWSGDAGEICSTLSSVGLAASWDNDPESAILIQHKSKA